MALAVFGFLLLGLSQTVRFGLLAWRQEARMDEEKPIWRRSTAACANHREPGPER